MVARRACDGCAVRKTRCDGQCPCIQCLNADLDCTFRKVHKRPGPKGPRKATRERLLRAIVQDVQRGVTESKNIPEDTGQSVTIPAALPADTGQLSPERIPLSSICSCLEIYRDRLYSIWPAVDSQALASRLTDCDPENDPEIYALATSVCAATLSQLRLDAVPVSSSRFEAETLRARSTYDYRSG